MAAEVRRTQEGTELALSGQWGVREFGAIEAELAAVQPEAARQLLIDAQGLSSLDLSGAWALHQFLERMRAAGVEVRFKGSPPEQLRLLDATLKEADEDRAEDPAPRAPPAPPPIIGVRLLTEVGRKSVLAYRNFLDALSFVGEITVSLIASLKSLRRLRPTSIARHVYDTGFTALPIVALIAFLISVIIAYMSAQQLRGLGADIYVVDLVTIGVLRELGVLLTSIIVAGRSGSAFAAELGSMQLNEEVDALVATGVDPIEVLVVPRLLGLTIALPALTIVADLVGLAGGSMLCRFLLDMPFNQYFARVQEAISPSTFWVGFVKAPVFALLIASAGCYRGMQVRGSARELGRLVTVAVVQAIFLVILADALFAVLFMEMDL
ncbi:MAG TPA: ABC transporter permease [Steroidobacteraceae bacterium]|jgi:phospholipid/cholesterol/gamma-HCH transport system permease protein|nr:ABC transporter permease [Steroidobacteraceae bacterium]